MGKKGEERESDWENGDGREIYGIERRCYWKEGVKVGGVKVGEDKWRVMGVFVRGTGTDATGGEQ